jgi:hypothetical protein
VQYPGHKTCTPADRPAVGALSRISERWRPGGLWHLTMAWLGAATARYRSAAASMTGSFPSACLQTLVAEGRT